MTMTRTRLTLSAAAFVCAVSVAVLALAIPQTQAEVAINSGDLVRGQSFSAVYYVGEDGFRYVFPNDKAYFTWYSNFNSVKVITDAQLSKIQIGGNITYKPGVKMVKINTDPKTYAVDAGGTLRHVGSEAVAVALYGSNWNTKIDDIADGFFPNYTIGEPIVSASSYSPTAVVAAVSDINDDKSLMPSVDFVITDDGFESIELEVEVGQGVRFINEGDENHTATADNLSWGTGTLKPGDSFIRKFNTEGTFTFFDSYDSTNTGAIYVE
jgi:plastocyanin